MGEEEKPAINLKFKMECSDDFVGIFLWSEADQEWFLVGELIVEFVDNVSTGQDT